MDNQDRFSNYDKKNVNGITYICLCSSDIIFEGKGRKFQFGDDNDAQIAVFRIKGKLYCLYNICPHRHQDQIFNGIIDGLNISCPVHGWTYSLETGQNINQKQGIRSLKSYSIFEESGKVWVEMPVFETPKWKLAES